MKKLLTVLSVLLLLAIPTTVAGNQDDNNPNTFEYKSSLFSGTADVVEKVIPSVVYIFIEQRATIEPDENNFGGLMPPSGVPTPANDPVCENNKVLTPITSPCILNKGPPELPWLITASD